MNKNWYIAKKVDEEIIVYSREGDTFKDTLKS